MKQHRRKFIKELIATGVIATCIPEIGFSSALNAGSGRLKAKKGMVFLFQGDSITDGNRGRNNDPNHIMGHGYAFSIASRLGADYPEKQFQFYNRGISGNTILDLAQRWQTDTIDLQPDVLSILIGANDCS